LYPMLAIGILQIAANQGEKSRVVVVVGAEHLRDFPPLLNPRKDGFEPSYFSNKREAGSIKVDVAKPGSFWYKPQAAAEAVRNHVANAVILIPPDVRDRIESMSPARLPILYDSTDESSQ